jgi:hypothetical protein
MLPSLYGPKIFRASPEKDFFDSIDPTRTFSRSEKAMSKRIGSRKWREALAYS